jgi:trehalose monomycolate/heme transporter
MPLKAIILNILSLSATFGGLVWIFQDGHLQNLLNFQSTGSIDATQPVLIFAIAFGLSMDYEVFLLSRIKERFDQTGNSRMAVSSGLQRTGWLITSEALLLAIVLGAFGMAKIIFIQEIGVGLAIAVIMDATLIRMVLVPATMHLLGDLNWWAPGPLRRLCLHASGPSKPRSGNVEIRSGKNGAIWREYETTARIPAIMHLAPRDTQPDVSSFSLRQSSNIRQ